MSSLSRLLNSRTLPVEWYSLLERPGRRLDEFLNGIPTVVEIPPFRSQRTDHESEADRAFRYAGIADRLVIRRTDDDSAVVMIDIVSSGTKSESLLQEHKELLQQGLKIVVVDLFSRLQETLRMEPLDRDVTQFGVQQSRLQVSVFRIAVMAGSDSAKWSEQVFSPGDLMPDVTLALGMQ